MSARTLDRTTFTPTNDPSVWYAGSRSRPGIQYRIERVGHPDMWCACPATKRCAHLNELAELLAAATPAKDEWNDIAPVRASEKEAPLNAPESPTALTVVGRELQRTPESALAAMLADEEKMAAMWETIAPTCTPPERAVFTEVCRSTGLNPFVKQIYPMKSGGKNPKMSIIVGIDGFRLIAQRTGQYDGQDGPYWCGEDGIWRDVWVSKEPPVAAKVVVYRKDASRPFTGIANYDAYVQTSKDWDTGQIGPNPMWQKMAISQLAKCAEALALRKGFPAEMSGLYTEDEMGQANNPRSGQPREIYIEGGTPPEQERASKPKYPWAAEFAAALKESPFELDDVCGFLLTDRAHSGPAINAWLVQGSPRDLMTAVGRWADNGRKHPEPDAAPATEPEMFDEAEWRDPSAEDMPQEAQG